MTDKEMNMAILNELYNIASGVWSLMEKNITGSFTAREIYKHIGKGLAWGDADEWFHEITVGTFHCKLSNDVLFDIVARFEALAGIGKNRRMFVSENKGEVEGSVTFEVSKDMRSLCDFADSKSIQPAYQYIFIDTVRNCLVATDGYKLMVQPVAVSDRQGDTTEMRINAVDFCKMCQKMKSGKVYQMTARKEHIYLDHITKIEFEGVLSSVSGEYVTSKWATVFEKRSRDLRLSIEDWRTVCAFAKSVDSKMLIFSGKHGDNFLTVEASGSSRTVELRHIINYDFRIYLGKTSIMASKDNEAMRLYLGKGPSDMVQATGDFGCVVYGFMPGYADDSFVGNRCDDKVEKPRVEMNVDILRLYAPVQETEASCETIKKPESQPVSTEKKNKKAETKRPARRAPADNSRKFTFEAIGVKLGDTLTFVDGTEVVAIEGTRVSYDGKEYTLSGFCKTFMPEEKRNKANSYRGCAFFYRDGVKLEKLFKDVLKAAESTMDNPAPASVSTDVPTTAKQEGITPSDREANVAEPMAETRRQADADIYAPILAHGLRSNLSLLSCVPASLRRPTTIPLRHNKAFTRLIWRRGGLRHDRRVAVAPDARITGVQDATVHTLPLPPPPAMI